MSETWTPERVEKLKTLFAQGLSASRIVVLFDGHFTRNAILGKIHRLGLPTLSPTAKSATLKIVNRRTARPAPKVKAAPKPARVAPEPRVAEELKPSHPVDRTEDTVVPFPGTAKALMDLGPVECRWPLGALMEPAHLFCGARALGEGPYCAAHAARAFVASPKRAGTAPTPRRGPGRTVFDRAAGAT